MHIINLRQVKEDDLHRAGKKAALLGNISGEFNIAPGYVLTKEAFDKFIEHNMLGSKIRQVLGSSDLDNPGILQDKANELQKLVLAGALPMDIQEGIMEAYYSLNIDQSAPLNEMVDSQSDPIVVVRASPITEAETLSIIHVHGKQKLMKSILAVFASIFTAQSILAHAGKGARPEIAVIMQKMLMPQISGYLEGNANKVIVRACYGLSDENTDFDMYLVDEGKLVDSAVKGQETAFLQDPQTGRFTKLKLSDTRAQARKLNDKQASALARLWQETGLDKKIEYIIDTDNYYFVQVSEGKMPDDNTIFSLFNANKGNKKVDIPTEPKPEQPVSDESAREAGQQPVTGGSVNPQPPDAGAQSAGSGVSQEQNPPVQETQQEPAAQASQIQDDTPKSPEMGSNAERGVSQASPVSPVNQMSQPAGQSIPAMPGEEPVHIIPEEEPQQTKEEPRDQEMPQVQSVPEQVQQQAKEQEMSEVQPMTQQMQQPEEQEEQAAAGQTHVQSQTEKGEPGHEIASQSAKMKPLSKDEWLETLEAENTRALLSYHMIILGILRRKYSEIIDGQPQDFRQMLQALSEKVQVPQKEKLLVLHNLRNRFYNEHRNVNIRELAAAHEITRSFISDFL